ncbi:hypothetical protein AS361_15915 [Myroides marinus]|uniref:restriction endonuclease subunit S n=1 Tax=Myroides TaxID=76831 RepID=UPI000280A96E|nr:MULTISPECIES: restriction endonuclease subunit S [Myroides]EKB06363.1 hypothetical protein HMPREF9711_00735 [Myroides odoratimimus CCUG 3837]KUF44536.1 hypothetical protein AS361_15915 [Myroides marinus]
MREDWVECTFEDVFFTTSGGTPSRQKSEYYNGSIPWVKSGELKSNIITETEEYITELAVEKSSAKLFPKGTLLLALYGATIGKTAILGIDATTNQAICGIFETHYVFTKYTYYYLQNRKEHLIKLGTGGAQPNISQNIVKALNFPLPPLPEQRAIVKKIEALFSSLDAGIADLKKAQEQLEIYRQAVLKKAFEGELTKEWRENGEYSLREENLGNILTVSSGKNLTKTKMRPGTIPVYGGNGIMGYHNEYNNDEVKLIIGRVGVKCGVTHLTEKHSWITDNALIVNFYYPQDYDLQFMQLKLLYENLNKLSNSTAQPVISGTQIYAYKVLLPQKEEQSQIVKEIETRLSVCDAVEQQIKDSLSQAEALRQSILKKAFEGKLLTEEEIKACQLEADYEPAAVLLEKIKAEKETNKSSKKIIKGKPKKKMEKKEILQLLAENNNEMLVDQLWKNSVYAEDIDAFYLKLKELAEEGKITEEKNGKKVSIKLI